MTPTDSEASVTLIAAEEKETLLPTPFEQYHQLKVSLLNRYPGLKHKVVMIVSSTENEGCTTTAVNLARALASDGKTKVLLIDGNLRSSSLHKVFGLDNRNGLLNTLRGETDPEEVIKKSDIDNLFVVTAGDSSGMLAGMTDAHAVDSVLGQLKKHFDFVIMDASPVSLYPDSINLCPKVDGVIVVVEAERTRWQVAERTKERLRSAGGKILGGVLSKRKHYIPEAIYKRL